MRSLSTVKCGKGTLGMWRKLLGHWKKIKFTLICQNGHSGEENLNIWGILSLNKALGWTQTRLRLSLNGLDQKQYQNSGFLGLARYYWSFINNYAHIAAPASNLLKKVSSQWSKEVDECFEILKMVVILKPMLATPGCSKPFVAECDVLEFGIVVVLMHDGKLIAFESKKLNKRESLKSSYHKEMRTIKHALEKWL